ncbi:MAG TPA: ABC transporter substrate-binding protein [Lachnospiraceae bacterium]|nr:ABC transporter substrate-binding protein [Lachnospiraceae bacterium]
MKKMRKVLAMLFVLILAMTTITACSSKKDSKVKEASTSSSTDTQSSDATAESTDSSDSTASSAPEDGKTFNIGVCQLVTHEALDAAYKGFVDGLAEAGFEEGKNVTFDLQNAQGEPSNCNTIATKLVNDNPDLILAIATPAAQSLANATKDIPILVTAVTDPATSGIVDTNEAPGGNVTGTSDLTPVQKQMELLVKLLPDAKKVAILYCSSEANSQIQADMANESASTLGLETVTATVSNSNEIQQVVQSLVGKVDAIYTPTDNTIASGMATVSMVANANGIPVICGEEGMVANGGLATYGINYYNLGKQTAAQAVKILNGEAKPADMPIEYLEEVSLTINEEVAAELGIEIPQDLKDEMNKK